MGEYCPWDSSGGKEVWRRGWADAADVADMIDVFRRFMEGLLDPRSIEFELRFLDAGSDALEYGGEPAGEKAGGGDAIVV